MAIQWMGLCVAAALICALLRPQRPELATAISLAAGVAAVAFLVLRLRAALPGTEALNRLMQATDPDAVKAILRAAGITVIGEMGAQLCRDAGERALAGRIQLITRVAILALCVPIAGQLVDLLWQLAP